MVLDKEMAQEDGRAAVDKFPIRGSKLKPKELPNECLYLKETPKRK